MVNDNMLKAAAAEAERCYFEALAARYPEDHAFSGAFGKKMSKVIRRANAPIRYRFGRIVIAAVLAIVILAGAVLAISPEVREDVVDWIKRTVNEFTAYISTGKPNTGNPSDPAEYDYQLGILPEGYYLQAELPISTGKLYIYCKDDNSVIVQFQYQYPGKTDINGNFIKTEGYTQTTGSVHGMAADIYLTDVENESNVIIWQDPKQGVMFQIFAKESKERLIEMAESVFIKES